MAFVVIYAESKVGRQKSDLRRSRPSSESKTDTSFEVKIYYASFQFLFSFESNMVCSHIETASLNHPSAYTQVYKDECTQCFDSQVSFFRVPQ